MPLRLQRATHHLRHRQRRLVTLSGARRRQRPEHPRENPPVQRVIPLRIQRQVHRRRHNVQRQPVIANHNRQRRNRLSLLLQLGKLRRLRRQIVRTETHQHHVPGVTDQRSTVRRHELLLQIEQREDGLHTNIRPLRVIRLRVRVTPHVHRVQFQQERRVHPVLVQVLVRRRQRARTEHDLTHPRVRTPRIQIRPRSPPEQPLHPERVHHRKNLRRIQNRQPRRDLDVEHLPSPTRRHPGRLTRPVRSTRPRHRHNNLRIRVQLPVHLSDEVIQVQVTSELVEHVSDVRVKRLELHPLKHEALSDLSQPGHDVILRHRTTSSVHLLVMIGRHLIRAAIKRRLPRTVVERCRVLLHPPRHGGRGFPLELSGKPRNVDSSHT